jgi:hypothetical protein
MTKRANSNPDNQLGFDALLLDADRSNHARAVEKKTAHLPDTMTEALPFFVKLLAEHHAAMLAADVERVKWFRKEARNLALRLNGGNTGILADDTSPGNVLRRETAAPADSVPLWGQDGSFILDIAGIPVRVAMDGLFGIGAGFSHYPGFSIHVVDASRPFLSPTGYRSFLGIHADPVPDLTVDAFVRKVLTTYLAKELKGRLVPLEPAATQRVAA